MDKWLDREAGVRETADANALETNWRDDNHIGKQYSKNMQDNSDRLSKFQKM